MMAMTTSSSMRVKAEEQLMPGLLARRTAGTEAQDSNKLITVRGMGRSIRREGDDVKAK